MDRAERTGLSVAVAGHILLFGALSLSLLRPPPKLVASNPPIDVALIDAKSLQTAAPDAVREASPPPAGEPTQIQAPMPEPAAPPPIPAKTPPPKPEAAKTPAKPKPEAKTSAPAAKQKPASDTRTSRLDQSLAARLSRAASQESAQPGTGRGTAAAGSGTPAARTAAQLEASFIQALFGQIKRYWRAPTGVDAELLKTNIVVTLKRDGTIASITIASQSGVTENNANLKTIHAERAVSAIRRAAPFQLPPEHYAIWQSLGPITFDKRLD
jgi:outer membrane biosynthesis protein TonB